jgi:hypothetical protein
MLLILVVYMETTVVRRKCQWEAIPASSNNMVDPHLREDMVDSSLGEDGSLIDDTDLIMNGLNENLLVSDLIVCRIWQTISFRWISSDYRMHYAFFYKYLIEFSNLNSLEQLHH